MQVGERGAVPPVDVLLDPVQGALLVKETVVALALFGKAIHVEEAQGAEPWGGRQGGWMLMDESRRVDDGAGGAAHR